MKAVVSRVLSASVTVNGEVVGELDAPGLLVLVGVTHSDTAATAKALAAKIFQLRILAKERSCASAAAPLLVVSQFTLYGATAKGRRPSWSAAAPGPQAAALVDAFIAALRALGARVRTGIFGADMKVASINDGPFTVIVEIE